MTLNPYSAFQLLLPNNLHNLINSSQQALRLTLRSGLPGRDIADFKISQRKKSQPSISPYLSHFHQNKMHIYSFFSQRTALYFDYLLHFDYLLQFQIDICAQIQNILGNPGGFLLLFKKQKNGYLLSTC